MNKKIYLIGFMGAGKSTVGQALAERLGWGFIDTDALLVSRFEMPIESIFEKKGEDCFRAAETQLIQEMSECSHSIIALGGGSFICPENRGVLLKTGTCIFLKANVDTLQKRLLEDQLNCQKRPLLKKFSDPEQLSDRIAQLLRDRNSFYEKAHFTVSTDQKTVAQVVEELMYIL